MILHTVIRGRRFRSAKYYGVWATSLTVFWLFCLPVMAGEPPWNDVESGSLFVSSEGENASASWSPGTHLRTHSEVNIYGLLVNVALRQEFVNDSEHWQEALYVLPLPDQAAIYGMRITSGDREIVAQIKPKAEAIKTYQSAKVQGKQAALLVQQRPNLFTQKIANIPPGELITVHVEYMDRAHFTAGRFSWRLPTTLTPRYTPALPSPDLRHQDDELKSASLGVNRWESLPERFFDVPVVTPPMDHSVKNPLSVDISLHPGVSLRSVSAPNHKIQAVEHEGQWRVSLANGEVPMDRDFILEWFAEPHQVPVASVFHERFGEEDFLMLTLIPPVDGAVEPRERDILFVLDTSGSMAGASIEQAKAALDEALSQLSASDRFNIVAFNNRFHSLFPGVEHANTDRRHQARAWVRALRAEGGTEMSPVLKYALSGGVRNVERLQQVVFITDGAVGNEAELFRLIHENLNERRMFTVGIGSAPNSYFMRKAAQFGRGTFTFISNSGDVQEKMQTLFTKLGTTVAANLQLDWPGEAEVYPARIPDLYAGEPLTVVAKLDRLQGELRWQGMVGNVASGQPWRGALNLDAVNSANGQAGIAKSWARDKVASLLDEVHLGADPDVMRDAVSQLGVQYSLVTPYTSFVAVEEMPSRPVDAMIMQSEIRNRIPRGQVWSSSPSTSIAYPSTATPMFFNVLVGAVALILLAVGCGFSWRREE